MNKHLREPIGTGRVVGYQRIGTVDHTTNQQLAGIELDEVFVDHASVKDRSRLQLRELVRQVREGDEVVVLSMDRLASSLDELRRTIGELTAKGAQVRFVKEGLTFGDTSAPCAGLMLSAMGAVAEFERALLFERQREDIVSVNGVQKGHRPLLTPEQAAAVARRLDEGESASGLAREYGVSPATVYNMGWPVADVIAVDHLYRQHGYPLDASHRLVDDLARRLSRTPTAIAERMRNLHGAHTESGYPGTRWHFTKLDRKVADRKEGDW